MKPAPWLNGKNNIIQTLERQTANRVFPTSVYLDRLDVLAAAADKSNEEARKLPQLELIKTEEEESLSSFDTLRKDPNLLIDPTTPAARPKRATPYSDPEGAISTYGQVTELAKSKSKKMNFTKNNSSYSLNKGSKAKSPSKQQLIKKQQMIQGHQQHLEDQVLRRSQRGSSTQNSEAGSFHFLHPEELREMEEGAGSPKTPTSSEEPSDIQWSGNPDRLI